MEDRTYINLEEYARKDHFLYFKKMAYPYVGTTVNVDITDFRERMKKEGHPFFLSFLYSIVNAANDVPEFRRRIVNDSIVEYKNCHSSHTVLLENETYCYCELNCRMPFLEFLQYATEQQEEAKKMRNIKETESESLLYISCVPWFSYTSLVQPTPYPADSNPRITWGKYFEQEGRCLIPVSILAHHGLVDGLHIAQFYETLSKWLPTN